MDFFINYHKNTQTCAIGLKIFTTMSHNTTSHFDIHTHKILMDGATIKRPCVSLFPLPLAANVEKHISCNIG